MTRSWPGLTRPSTSSLPTLTKKDVDARVKPAHDGARRRFSASGLRLLKLALDDLQQPQAHRAVVAPERNHEAHAPMLGGVGIARQGADAGKRAGLVAGAVVAGAEQGGVGREELQQLGQAARREVIVAADARSFLEMNGIGKVLLGEHLVRDLERLLEADRPAEALPADLQENLVGDVVVGADEQGVEEARKAARLPVNVDRFEAGGHGSGRDLALHAAAGPRDECGDQLAGILQPDRGLLRQADAAASFRAARPEL